MTEKETIAVVGLGYVGFPVALGFAEAGFPVVGIDILEDRIDGINRGISPIKGHEPGLQDLFDSVRQTGRFTASSDAAQTAPCSVKILAIQTPLSTDTHTPNLEILIAAARSIFDSLNGGDLIIVESTIPPGTMEGTVIPAFQAGVAPELFDTLQFAHVPERVMPGKLLLHLKGQPRIIGASSPEAAERARALYSKVVSADLDVGSLATAELVKTSENAYRDTQISFANAIALLSEQFGVDVYRVRELVNKVYARDMHIPGVGVGGHCLPKDPWLMVANARPGLPTELIRQARALNDDMPAHMLDLIISHWSGEAPGRLLVLGYSYLANSDDVRNSPSEILIDLALEQGWTVAVHDPHVSDSEMHPRVERLQNITGEWDVVALLVAHNEYRTLDWNSIKCNLVADGRGVIDPGTWSHPTARFIALGRGQTLNPKPSSEN